MKSLTLIILRTQKMSIASSPFERTENEGREKVEQKIIAIPRGCDNARVEQVIVTRALKGAGTENDPCREVIQYWTLDGELIVTRSRYEEGKR